MTEPNELTEAGVRAIADASTDRFDLWTGVLRSRAVACAAEIGVYRGTFAERMLTDCPALERYYLVDPWRHLDAWNKPANKSDDVFEGFYAETMRRTEAQAAKRVVLRGLTTEVIDQIPDASLDFVYIDGDHTLRGITTDLARLHPKIRDGGLIGGDDFYRNIFHHGGDFEPTLVFPYAIYFAEAMGERLFALPHRQFLIQKGSREHEFVDLVGNYDQPGLLEQVRSRDRRRAKQRAEQRAEQLAEKSAAQVPAPRRTTAGRVRSLARRLGVG